jgi:hypothetical protein
MKEKTRQASVSRVVIARYGSKAPEGMVNNETATIRGRGLVV